MNTFAYRVAVAITAGLVLSGCTSEPPAAPAPSSTPAASSSSSGPVVAVGRTHTYADGLTVAVTEIVEAKLPLVPNTDAPAAKVGDPYLLVTLVWENRGKATVSVFPNFAVTHGVGHTLAHRVYVDEDDDAIPIEAGKTHETTIGLIIPAADRPQVRMVLNDAEDPTRQGPSPVRSCPDPLRALISAAGSAGRCCPRRTRRPRQ